MILLFTAQAGTALQDMEMAVKLEPNNEEYLLGLMSTKELMTK